MMYMNNNEKRTLNLWYLGLMFGAAAMSISLYSLWLYHRDLGLKYGRKTTALPPG